MVGALAGTFAYLIRTLHHHTRHLKTRCCLVQSISSPRLTSVMITFHLSDQQLDNDLVTSISSLLDAVNVPNLLWGNYLLTVYGVPTIFDVSICMAGFKRS